MDYETVFSIIQEYQTLYSCGLKKKANALMKDLSHNIEELSDSDKNVIMEKLLYDICDNETLDALIARGNAQIPFELKGIIHKWLYPRCQAQYMPELRWFYQLFRNDRDNCEMAYSFLEQAYVCTKDDKKTLMLVFDRNLSALSFGLHELPIGLLISDEEFEDIVRQCEDIIAQKVVSQQMIDSYLYLKNDYLSYVDKGEA